VISARKAPSAFAHRHRTRNLFVAAAGIGRQQYLGALELAGSSFALLNIAVSSPRSAWLSSTQ
jgi:hypothetical protein